MRVPVLVVVDLAVDPAAGQAVAADSPDSVADNAA